MRIFVLLSFFTVSVFGAIFQSSNQAPTPNFKFEYPEANWELLPSRTEKTEAQLVDKNMAQQTLVTIQRKQSDEKYHARFHVVADSLEKFKDSKTPLIAQYQKHTVDFLKSQRFQILSVEPVQLPYIKESTVEIVANQRDFGLKFKQVIFVYEGKAYILTATTRTEKFNDYRNEIKPIFDTFQFVKETKK